MSMLDLLRQAQGGGGLAQLGAQLGLDAKTTEALAGQLAPAISGGVKRRAAQEGGLGAILGQLQGEGRAAYYDDGAAAAAPAAQAAGQDFLAQIFGAREAAPQLARAAAERCGAPADKAEQLMPALAAMLQGGMQRAAPDQEIKAVMGGLQSGADRAGAGLGDLMGMLSQAGGGQGGGLGGMLGAITGGGGGAARSGGGGGALGGIMNALGGGGGGGGAQPQAAQAGGLAPLLQMLDADGDGSPLDDIIGQFLK